MSPPIVLLFALLAAAGPAVADWPQWGGPTRNFSVADPGLADRWPESGPTELWRRPLGDGYSGIAQQGGRLFTMYRDSNRDAVISLDAATGETLWTQAWEAPAHEFMDLEFGPGTSSTPLVAGPRVFAVGSTGRLVALDLPTGRALWARELWTELQGTPLERGYAASPIAFEDLVIVPVGGPSRALVAFRQTNGSIAWSRHDHGIAYASPILVRLGVETELVALLDRALLGVDPRTGDQRWIVPVSDHRYVNVASPFSTDDGLLFVVSSEGGRTLQLERDGEQTAVRELWVGKSLGSQVGNVARFGDLLVGTRGSSASKYLTAVRATTGEIAWRDRSVGDCTLLRVGDRALLLESDGRLHLAKLAATGLEILSSGAALDGRSWTAPTLAGTRLYLRNRKEIVALELGAESLGPP